VSSLTWPADRFYWAVLDAPGVRAGIMPSGLAASLQDELPVDVDTLHAVATPIENARVLVCAVKREDLAALPPEVLSLTPSEFPDIAAIATDILSDAPAPRLPELLTGPFEPKPLRRERALRTSILAASILLTAALISTGLLRRVSSLHEHADAARSDSATLLRDATSSGTLDALTRETTRYQSLAATPHALTPPDAAAALASLLRTWPDGAACEANSVSINPTTMSLAFSLDSDPRTLLSSLKAPAGWTLEEPRLASTANNTRVTLTLKRMKEGAR
jgi:hypothetical protein